MSISRLRRSSGIDTPLWVLEIGNYIDEFRCHSCGLQPAKLGFQRIEVHAFVIYRDRDRIAATFFNAQRKPIHVDLRR